MELEIFYLALVFSVIIAALWMKRPLCVAIFCGIAAAVLLFRLPFIPTLKIIAEASVNRETISVLLAFYVITILQRMLEDRDRLNQAQRSFDAVFEDSRVNVSFSTSILGLLPSAAVMNICAAVVDKTCGSYLSVSEKMHATLLQPPAAPILVPGTIYIVYALIAGAVLFLTAICFMLAHIKQVVSALKRLQVIMGYGRNARRAIKRAKKLLKSTELPTSEIAAQVGYKDPHYFSFVFKKTQGCSPREYRSGI